MPLPNGINKNNFTPKGNSSPLSGGNSKPTGVTSGTWVSGNKTQRGDSISQRRKRGLNTRKRSLKKISQPQPSNTATNATATSGAAIARQGIAQKSLSVSGKLAKAARPVIGAIKAVTLIGAAKVLGLASLFVAATAEDVADGTIPDWVRDVGEIQVVKPPPEPPFIGGQEENTLYNVTVYYHQTKTPGCSKVNENTRTFQVRGKITGAKYTVIDDKPFYNYDCFGLGKQDICYGIVAIGSTTADRNLYVNTGVWCSIGLRPQLTTVEILSVTRADGQPNTEADLHDLSEDTTFSTPTTDLSKVSVSSTPTATVSDIRPSTKVSIPTIRPTSSLPKTSPTQKRIDSPSITPTALPTVESIPEKSVDDISEPDDKEVIAPPVISTRSSIRADGTRETITTREATAEELRTLEQTRRDALETVDTFREQTQFRGGIDAFIPSPGSPSQPGTFEETTRTPALPPNITPPPNITDDSNIKDPNPQPDIEDEDETPFIPPPPVQTPPPECKGCNKKILDKMDTLTLGAQGLDLALVQQIHSTVHSSAHGLAKIQSFAETAWRTTRAGKVLEYLGLVATLHNAAMLSRNVGQSLGDITSAIANNTISFLTNEESNDIDINETLGNTIENVLRNALGEEIYNSTSESFLRTNRIVNAASNIIYSVTAVNAGLAQGLETIGNYTGKIGNALKKSGAVLESSYSWMSEKVSVKTGRIGQIQAIIDGGEQIENFASDIQNATEEFREAQENVTNIGEQFNKVKTEIASGEAEIDATNATSKTNSQGASPELTDFVRDPYVEQT